MVSEQTEQEFARFVTEHKSTIYTVCYMFSKDEDEVADLFEEVIINLWKRFQGLQGQEQSPHLGISREPEHVHLARP